jgi:hypothetical protein
MANVHVRYNFFLSSMKSPHFKADGEWDQEKLLLLLLQQCVAALLQQLQ